MSAVKGLIYDCDGVLFESRAANLAYYNAVLEVMGEASLAAEDDELADICHTAASPVVFRVLLGEERVATAMEIAGGLDYRRFIPKMTPEPNLVETLAALSQHLPLAVATNRGNSMTEILQQFSLAGYFRAVVTSRDVPRPKPAPDMLLLAAERLQLEPQELLFVGDSTLDRQASGAAGIRFIGYKMSGEGEWVDGHPALVDLLKSEGAFGSL